MKKTHEQMVQTMRTAKVKADHARKSMSNDQKREMARKARKRKQAFAALRACEMDWAD